MDFDLVTVLLGISLLALAGCAAYIVRLTAERARLAAQLEGERVAQEEMSRIFSLTAQEALQKSSETFLQLAREKLVQAQAEGGHDLEKRQKAIETLVDPIGKTLKEMEQKIETLGKAGAGINAQLSAFAEDQRLLRQETQNLVQALRNPAARGRWGEMQLQRALEMIGMIEGTHYRQQVSVSGEGARARPDFIIQMPGNMEIVVDVKTPVEPYWDALEKADSEAARDAALQSFRRHMRDHLKALSGKEYWRHFDAPEFVVMFLPTEGLYTMAVSGDPALIEDAARANVILASPTTLMGLLRVVMHGWQQQKMAEEAKTVSALAADLYNRLCAFGDHMQRIGTGLGTAIGAYNKAVGSLENSVLRPARKLRELHVQTGGKELAEMGEIAETARTPELTHQEKEDGDAEAA